MGKGLAEENMDETSRDRSEVRNIIHVAYLNIVWTMF